MIPNEEGWHCIAVKKFPALLRRITWKHQADFYCLTCLHSFRTKNKLESHKKVYENKDFYNIVVPSEDTKILEFIQYQKPDEAPFNKNAKLYYIYKENFEDKHAKDKKYRKASERCCT